MSNRDRDPANKWQSGQFVDGVYEFDGSETFLDADTSEVIEKIGTIQVGRHLRVRRHGKLGKSHFQVIGKRMMGQKMIIVCDRMPSADEVFYYVRYTNKRERIDDVVGVEAIEHHSPGFSPRSFWCRVRGRYQWVDANMCMPSEDPERLFNYKSSAA